MLISSALNVYVLTVHKIEGWIYDSLYLKHFLFNFHKKQTRRSESYCSNKKQACGKYLCRLHARDVVLHLFWRRWPRAAFAVTPPARVTDSHRLSSIPSLSVRRGGNSVWAHCCSLFTSFSFLSLFSPICALRDSLKKNNKFWILILLFCSKKSEKHRSWPLHYYSIVKLVFAGWWNI